jgi:hypothetical protein
MLVKKKNNHRLNPEFQDESGLASFVERPIPEEAEVNDFEKAVQREIRDQEIDSHLMDVYSDKLGQRVDVGKMKIKKRPNFFWNLFKRLFILVLLAAGLYFIYVNYLTKNNDISSLALTLSAPEKVIAAEEFSYRVEYYNPTKYVFSGINLEMQYPDNFVFASASINPTSGNYGFVLPDLGPEEKASLTITGQIINSPDSVNLAIAHLSYLPGTFSSHYKKEASVSTLVDSLGFSVNLENSGAIFLGSDNELKLAFSENLDSPSAGNLSDFDIVFIFSDGSGATVDLASSSEALVSSGNAISSTGEVLALNATSSDEKKLAISKQSSFVWHLSGLNQELVKKELIFNYRVANKVDNFEVKINLRRHLAEKDYNFWEKTIKPELVSSDLNLMLFLNGSKDNQALDFGTTLNYSLNYSNRGDKSYKDVVIMAALNGDSLDWNSLKITGGEKNKGAVTWTKSDLPQLAEIKSGEEGEINFSIKLKEFSPDYLGKNSQVISYAQYSVNNQAVKGDNNKSNTITSGLNSDLALKEELRYFDSDNLPVGSGPLPPKVGEKTSFRVYWTVTNNLHELRDTKVVLPLPAYVSFADKVTTKLGRLYYDEASRQIIWEIGLLPVSTYQTEASFDLSISPTDSDHDKILILSPGSVVSALDTETQGTISRKIGPKTTKLEDDDIAGLNNSGRVQ